MKLYVVLTIFLSLHLTNSLAAPLIEYSSDTPDSLDIISLDFQQDVLNSTSGLYFDEMSNLQVYHTEWAFVTYVNLTYYTSEAEHLDRTVNTIQMLCNTIKAELALEIPNSYCENTMPQLHILMDEIKEYSTKWFISHETEAKQESPVRGTSRKKRGFFGSISKRLFFSMSEDEAEFYKTQINALKLDNAEHYLMLRNQTTLFQESLKVLNSTRQSQIIQRSALQKQLDDIEHLLNNAQASSALSNKLIELMQYSTFVVTSFWERQRYFFDAITTKTSSFHLIPPRMFRSELERVEQIIARQDLQLPLPLTGENLSKFYEITTTEGRIIDNNLVLRFSIPLVEAKKYILYRAISVPLRHEDSETISLIVPHNEYIALNSHNEQFVALTYEELKACYRLDRKNLVCKQTFPVISVNNHLGCEINMLRNRNATSNCDVRNISLTEERWTKLQRPNTYLYALPKPQYVAIICPNARTKVLLDVIGIISLRQRCRIKTEHVEIVAFQMIESKIVRTFNQSAKFNVSVGAEIDNAKHVKSLLNRNLPDINDADAIHITHIHDELNGMHVQNRINKASVFNSSTDNSGASINPIALVIIAIILLVVFILITFICFKYCAVQWCNIIILLIVIALVLPGIFYLF